MRQTLKLLFLIFFLIWLAVLPLVFWYGAYEGVKALIFIGGGLFLSLFWLINIFYGKFAFNKSDYCYWLWLTTLLLASMLGIHPVQSIIGGDYRHQGVLFFLTLWLAGKTIAILNNKEKTLFKNLILFAVVIESLVVISDYYLHFSNWKVFGFKGPLGTLGEPNATAGFIIMGLVVWLMMSFRSPSRNPAIRLDSRLRGNDIINLVVIILVGLAIIFLRSLTSVIIFGEYLVFTILKRFQRILFIIFFVSIIPVMFFAAFYQTKSIDIGQSLETRPVIWLYSLQAIIKRPVLGYGAESTTTVFDNLFTQKKIVNTSIAIDRSHNLILDLLMWSGIVGAFAFISWFVVNILELIKKKKWLHVAGALGWLTFASVQPLSVVHWILLMILINI